MQQGLAYFHAAVRGIPDRDLCSVIYADFYAAIHDVFRRHTARAQELAEWLARGPMLLQRPSNPVEVLVSDTIAKWSSLFAPLVISDFEHSIVLVRVKPWVNACLKTSDLTNIVCSYLSLDQWCTSRRDVFCYSSIPVPSTSCREQGRTESVLPHPFPLRDWILTAHRLFSPREAYSKVRMTRGHTAFEGDYDGDELGFEGTFSAESAAYFSVPNLLNRFFAAT
jgi:hypothetical protein